MNTLLVLTLGQTDVQLVVDGDRRELRKERCAALHDELEQRRSTWRIVDAPARKIEPPVETLPEGDLLLCTPKLDAVLREVVPTAALLLETSRDATSAPGDPRCAGAVLEARLRARCVKTIFRRAYLQGTERLEDRNQPRDAVIRREVVRRLECAVRESLDLLKPSRIVVVATGGFPVVSNLVEEIVRLHVLHASVPVDALEVADGSQASPPAADRAVSRTSVPEPLVSFQSRRRALELITKGNLLGAWAIAEPLHGEETERAWTRVIEWLARFASSLPIPEDCDLPVLTHKRMAVRAALRVELALRAGDVPRAVHGTVAFFEAALWDRLLEHFERDPNDARWLKLRDGKTAPTGKLLRDGGDDDKNRPFEAKHRSDGQTWFWFHESGAGRFARDYLQSQALKSLLNAVEKVKALRNDVAHNEPTPALMDDARRRMQEASLWSPTDGFLSQPLVQAVLRELGVQEPERLCTDLIAVVRSRLVNAQRSGESED